MSAQDKTERVLRKLHVLLSKSRTLQADPDYIIVNKTEALELLKQLAVCMTEMMDEYEMTKQAKEQAKRKNKKIGDEIIKDAKKKAEDVYAASVLYTDEALKRIMDIMQESNESVKAVFAEMEKNLETEKQNVARDKTELKSHLRNLEDTDKYMKIIEERNKKIAKEKKKQEQEEEDRLLYASLKPEIKINRDYFEKQGLDFDEAMQGQPQGDAKVEIPDIIVNLDSEYFKWKENGEKESVAQIKTTERKSLFGKLKK